MKRKLRVQELEARIAPSVGLLGALREIASMNTAFGDVFNQVVDADGNVDVAGATDAFNAMDTGHQVAPVVSEFTLSDNIVIPDAQKLADMINKFF